jgi:hypothetical protein
MILLSERFVTKNSSHMMHPKQLLIHPDPELVASHPESSNSEDSTVESALDSDADEELVD